MIYTYQDLEFSLPDHPSIQLTVWSGAVLIGHAVWTEFFNCRHVGQVYKWREARGCLSTDRKERGAWRCAWMFRREGDISAQTGLLVIAFRRLTFIGNALTRFSGQLILVLTGLLRHVCTPNYKVFYYKLVNFNFVEISFN